MTEEHQTPEQQVANTSAQQVDWQARYNGQQVKLQQNATTIQTLTAQVTELQQKIVDLTAQLSTKGTEQTTLVGQRDQTIQSLTQETSTLKTELATLKALQNKLAIIKKLGRPELISIMDAVPASEDPAQTEAAMNTLIGFADSMVQAREKQLAGGVTSTGGGNAVPSKPLPTTSADWEKHLNSLPMGSKERKEAMEQWGAWAKEQS